MKWQIGIAPNAPMTEAEILDLFKKTGALLSGHFLLTSGLHSDRYFQCARILQHPRHAERLGAKLARAFQGRRISAVVAPAVGGILVAHEVARALGTRALFTERQGEVMTLRRGFEIRRDEKLLVVEDVVTTGGSVGEVLDLVRARGATPVGFGCLVDRSGGRVDFGVETVALVRLLVQTFKPEECELCRRGAPLVKPGSREVGPHG